MMMKRDEVTGSHMREWIIWIAVLLLAAIMALQLPAQTSAPEDGIRATNVLPPEAYTFKFQGAGSVDFHGDYSASIPLMTVPGRGMDYPISASYKSGITTDARASWVGLGWNVNPGSITRVINGIPDNIKKCVIAQSSNGYTTENGAIVHYPPMASYSYNRPIQDDFDYFLVNIPGVVSGMIVPVNVNNDSVADFVFEENNGFSVVVGGRTFTRLMYDTTHSSPTNEYSDVGFFWITGPDGTRYIFSLPLRSEMIMYGGVPEFGGGLHFQPRFIVEYVSSWQLTAIIGPNTGATYVYPTGDMAIDEGSGEWVKFEYNYPYNGSVAQTRNLRPLYFDRQAQLESNPKDPFGLLTQTTYLSRIITPTHEAAFGTSPRLDISYVSPYAASPSGGDYKSGIVGDFTASSTSLVGTFVKPLRLDSITLYCRSPRARISFVKFNYAAQGSELCRYGVTVTGQTSTNYLLTSVPTGSGSIGLVGVGKTTLKEILFGDSSSAYFYRFKYTDEIDNFNPPYMVDGADQNGLGPIQAIAKHSAYATEGQFYRARTGRMGFLYAKPAELTSYSTTIQATRGAAAWSLRTIEYPTGAIDTINYEIDVFDLQSDAASNPMNILSVTIVQRDSIYLGGQWVDSTYLDTVSAITLSTSWWQRLATDELGLRVSRIGQFDPITMSTRSMIYTYSNGHLPGLPINFLRNSNGFTGVDQFRSFLFGYNASEVEYGKITITNADGSRSEDLYTSVESHPDRYDKMYTYRNFIQVQNNSVFRGKSLGRLMFDGDNRLRNRTIGFLNFDLEWSGFIETIDGWPTGYVNYYLGGRRLLSSYRVYKMNDSSYQYEKDLVNPEGPMKALIRTNNYSYDDYNQLVSETTVVGGFKVTTRYSRAYGSNTPAAAAMHSKRMVSQLYEKRVYRQGLDNQGTLGMTRMRMNWAQFGSRIEIQDVSEWSDFNGNGDLDDSEMVVKSSVLNYDNFGNPLAISDAYGTTTNLTWSPLYGGACLTKSSMTISGVTYEKKYTYNLRHQPTIIEDENGQQTKYFYDGHGRLKKVIGPDNAVLKTMEYNFRNQTPITWYGGGE